MRKRSHPLFVAAVPALLAVACLAAPRLANAQQPSLFQFPATFDMTTTSGLPGTGSFTPPLDLPGTYGQAGTSGLGGSYNPPWAQGHPAGQYAHQSQYILVTMRGGSTLQGSQLNQLRKQAGASLRLVQTDGAGNYLMQAVRPVSAGALANLVTQLKNNPNVQNAAPATVGRMQVLAKPGDAVLVKGTDLMAGAGISGPADTNAMWRQLAGQSMTFTANSPDLSFTVPQNTAAGNTGSSNPAATGAGTATGSTATGGTATGGTGALSWLNGSRGSAFVPHPHVGSGNHLVFEFIANTANGNVFVGDMTVQVQGALPAVPDSSTGSSGSGAGATGATGGSSAGGA